MRLSRRRRGRWQLAVVALGLALAALAMPVPASEAHICTPDPEIGVSGRLLMPGGSGFSELEMPSRASRQIAVTPAQGLTTAVARSLDGSQLAVTRFWRPPSDKVGGQDILLVWPDGGEPLATINRSQPGEALGSPAWLPDGSLVFERRLLSGSNEAVQVDRARPGGAAELVADGAAWPASSPDGSLLVMSRPATEADRGDELIARALAGGEERVLVDGARRLAIAFPRFSPDGAWIAFTGASDGLANAPVLPVPASGRVEPTRPATGASRLIGTMTASAHGIPWDVWVVRPDGSGLRRVTAFADDDSSVTWSPDGRWLVTLSAEALHAVALDSAENYCISNAGGYGGIEWLP